MGGKPISQELISCLHKFFLSYNVIPSIYQYHPQSDTPSLCVWSVNKGPLLDVTNIHIMQWCHHWTGSQICIILKGQNTVCSFWNWRLHTRRLPEGKKPTLNKSTVICAHTHSQAQHSQLQTIWTLNTTRYWYHSVNTRNSIDTFM